MNKIELNDFTIVVAGQAGQGVESVSVVLGHIFKAKGYNIYVAKDVMSRVRGGINSTSIRISAERNDAFLERIDFLIALHPMAYNHLKDRITDDTVIIGVDYEDENFNIEKVNFLNLAQDIGNRIFANSVAIGVIAGFLGMNKELSLAQISKFFSRKGEEIVSKNLDAVNVGYDKGLDIAKSKNKEYLFKGTPEKVSDNVFMLGSDVVGLGAVAGGCDFMSSYPMSPATGVLTFLAQNASRFNILVDQATDEIGAINSTLGAWYAGARGMVTTSGGGFCLMTEAVSLSGMTETPVVVHIAQRPGPATGLPTRTAQEDLNLVLHAGHGEFMRAIFAPGSPEQAYNLTAHAFNIADAYQIPVFVLTDQHFVDALYCVPKQNFKEKSIDEMFIKTEKDYKRYKLTDDGISPRGIPGYGEGLVMVDSDEHDEIGRITEDMDYTRIKMVEKRLFKRKKLLEECAIPPMMKGNQDAKKIIVSWGTNKAVVDEALDLSNVDIKHVYFPQLFPFHESARKILSEVEYIVVLENNATGQFADLLEKELGIKVDKRILSYSGRPFSVEKVLYELNNL